MVQFHPQPEFPLYRQLADFLRGKIDAGECGAGQQLPTEETLRRETGLSKGTIQSAYRLLEDEGRVQRRRGSGAYVLPPSGERRREEARRTVRALFDEVLSGMGAAESCRLLCAETARLFARASQISVALIDCSPEVLGVSVRQLAAFERLRVTPFSLDALAAGRQTLEGAFDFALTTQHHYAEVLPYASACHLPLEQLGMSLTEELLRQLALLPDGQPLGVLYRSRPFLDHLLDVLSALQRRTVRAVVQEDEPLAPLDGLTLLVAPDYADNASPAARDYIAGARQQGRLVLPFDYEIDRGSLVHLDYLVDQAVAARGNTR